LIPDLKKFEEMGCEDEDGIQLTHECPVVHHNKSTGSVKSGEFLDQFLK
jgi:hypothetical protein